MAYSKQSWNTGDPITQGKMRTIEQGIYDAHTIADTALQRANNANNNVSSLQDTVSGQATTIEQLQLDTSAAMEATTQGTKAWTQIVPLLEFEEDGTTISRNLATRITGDEQNIGDNANLIATIQGWITDAQSVGGQVYDSVNARFKNAESLAERIGEINRLITNVTNTANSTQQTINPTNGRSFADRLTSIDANQVPTRTLISIIEELENAHDSTQNSTTYNNIDARLEADELALNTHASQIGALDESRVKYIDIKNDFISTDTNKPLSAAKGKELKDTIGGSYSPSSTVAAGIIAAQTAAETNAQNYTDTNKVDKNDIYNGVDHTADDQKVLDARVGKTLQDQIDTINSGLNTADTGLLDRLSAAEDAISHTAENDDPGGLTERLTQAETDIGTIAGELSMYNTQTGAIEATNSRVDTIEANVVAIGKEIGMLQDEAAVQDLSTAVSRTNTRIDSIDTEIENAHRAGVSNDTLDNRFDNIESAISHSADALNSDPGGLTERIAVIEGDIETATTGIKARLTALETNKANASDLATLSDHVTSLETIMIAYDGEHSNFTSGVPNVNNPVTTADYLIADDTGKYFYWRYIQTASNPATYEWQLIGGAGGGGTGSSSGEFAASLNAITIPDPNVDYFVGNNTIGYTHYRYIAPVVEGGEGTFVRILPKGLLINAGVTANGGLEAYTVENSNDNVFSDFVAFKDVEATPVTENEQVIATDLVFTDTNGQTHTARVQGGGGGGSTSSYTMRLNNALSSLKLTVPKKDGYTAEVSAKVVVKDGGVIDTEFDQSHTINVAVQYRVSTSDPWTNYTTLTVLNNTEFDVDVTSILTLGTKTYVRLQATTLIDEEEKSSSLIYEVTQVEMSIAAVNFNQATVRTTNFNFQYRCMGSGLTKQVHFLIDNTDIAGSPVTTTLHNDVAQQVIPLTGLSVGMHSFQVYFTVDGIESNRLNYYIIYNNDSSRIAPIIALAAENSTITFGDDLKINYTVATNGTETTDSVVLELYALDGSTEVPYASQTLENVENEQVKEWRPVDYPESGTAYVRATATHTVNNIDYTDTKTIQITINELVLPAGYSLEPAGAANLVYSYNAYGRTNNDSGKEVYHYNYHALTGQNIEWTGSFNNFNWSGNGYVDGQTLTISGGATHTVNVPILANSYNGITLENSEGVTNISKLGRTIEIEYEVASATNLNDVIIDCMADGAGFQVTPQSCYLLKSGSEIRTDSTGFILNESDIAAAYLTPGMRIHLAFVIEPWSDTLAFDNSYHQSVNIYVNGEFANTCPYVQGTDSFASTATLRIGSSSCIIKLYQIKMYNRGLTHKEILQNYKVAPAATRDKLSRLYDNDILNADGYVDYEKARTKYTCLLLTGPAANVQDGVVINPTVSPYKGYPSPANRKDKKTGEVVGKTESGLTLTKPNPNVTQGYNVEFDLRDTIPTDQSIEVPAYMGARGAYVSSNNVQGTSSQKYPVHNLKVYLAKWQGPKTTTSWVALEENEEVPAGTETKVVTYKHVANDSELGYELVEVEDGEDTTGLTLEEITYKRVDTVTPAEIKKVKYSLKGKDEHGDDIGNAESTLCWKADYMSTDHANTFNANIADGLFTDTLPGASWGPKHQNTVYGIRCLLFQKQGNSAPEFLGDGCLNNDKGNNKTYDLERTGDDDADTFSQKWEFTNNSDDLGYFKTDTVFRTVGEGTNTHIQAKDAFESTYPDEGDLKDAGKEPNYNHLQILLTWLSKRANYWDASTTNGTGGTYNGVAYSTERELKKAIFINEFTDHINMDHALTYYLFSEYVALCDNRVKNMFFRSDNVKSETVYKISDGQPIFEGNSNPNADFFKAIDAIDTGTTQQVAIEDPETHEITYENQAVYRYELHNRDDIDWANSTFAVWAPVLYDLDSCFGVENVGYIRVRYDAEWNYTWNNAPQFNGYESRLWLQFADCFDTEIKTAALALYNRQDGLNYTNFYRQQITGNLSCISPALSNQDMLVKFDKPWSEGFMNYSLAEPAMETPYYKYLQRGSRTAQKTAFMNMRSKLLSSKYGANEFTNDAIKFRTGVPVGQDNLQDTKITVTANQAMYPGVAYGDNKEPTRATTNGGKVAAGQSCDIYATSPVQGNDGIFICGASLLTDIGDLSAFRPYQIDVGAGINLKRLIVGSDAAGYTNGNTDSLMNLNKCVLLEEVNVRNCTNVSTLDLSNNPLIKRVYAAGSGTTTVIFPNGGVLTTVEYSASTGNITILNQSGLTNFTYDGSSNNHYASLTKLWIENTPNVPVIDIITQAISHLTAGIRLAGLDLDIGSDPTFLETITSDLAKGKYLDASGAFTPGNTNYPYIQGKVHINSIRASLLAKVNNLYPNLIVYNTLDANGNPSNNTVPEYEIEYQNYDGTVLFTDYRTNEEYYIDPVYDTNPITNAPYITMPTKPADAQYSYRFGTYDSQNRYRRYSGWVKRGTTTNPNSGTLVNGNTVFVAVYPTTTIQTYTVTWYDELNGSQVDTLQVNYGTDLSGASSPIDSGLLPSVKSSGNIVKVFKGWSCPLGKITQNVNVYGQWESSTINNNTQSIAMESLTAADIYALSLVGNTVKRDLLEDQLGVPIMIKMGHDFEYVDGVNMVNLLGSASSYTLDGTQEEIHVYNSIKPLSMNGDWTIAIDYKFLMDSKNSFNDTTESVLASCYQNANSSIVGFKVSFVHDFSSTIHPVKVTWGTSEVVIDYVTTDYPNNISSGDLESSYFHSYRNVVVLSHNSNEPDTLRVTYVTPNLTNNTAPYGANYGTSITNTLLTWSNTNNIDVPLILGGNYNGATTNFEVNGTGRRPAQGVIYWAKYWDADLGETNCQKLAAWPHETVPFYLSGYNGPNSSNNTEQIYTGSELSFVAAQGIGDRYVYTMRGGQAADSNDVFGWHQSWSRAVCNNLVYSGMPEAYQSIIKQTHIKSLSRTIEQPANVWHESDDYMFLPAVREVLYSAQSGDINGQEVNTSWLSPWSWMVLPEKTNVWGLVSGSTMYVETKTVTTYAPYLYRFLGAYIKDTARIFDVDNDPTNIRNLTYRSSTGVTTPVTIQSGDVWVKSDDTAWMYFSAADIEAGEKIDVQEAGSNGGGWRAAVDWNLRSYANGNNATMASENLFLRVTAAGGVLTAPAAGTNPGARLLCPEFTV